MCLFFIMVKIKAERNDIDFKKEDALNAKKENVPKTCEEQLDSLVIPEVAGNAPTIKIEPEHPVKVEEALGIKEESKEEDKDGPGVVEPDVPLEEAADKEIYEVCGSLPCKWIKFGCDAMEMHQIEFVLMPDGT